MKIYINSMNMSLILLFLINVVSGCSNYEHVEKVTDQIALI